MKTKNIQNLEYNSNKNFTKIELKILVNIWTQSQNFGTKQIV